MTVTVRFSVPSEVDKEKKTSQMDPTHNIIATRHSPAGQAGEGMITVRAQIQYISMMRSREPANSIDLNVFPHSAKVTNTTHSLERGTKIVDYGNH